MKYPKNTLKNNFEKIYFLDLHSLELLNTLKMDKIKKKKRILNKLCMIRAHILHQQRQVYTNDVCDVCKILVEPAGQSNI